MDNETMPLDKGETVSWEIFKCSICIAICDCVAPSNSHENTEVYRLVHRRRHPECTVFLHIVRVRPLTEQALLSMLRMLQCFKPTSYEALIFCTLHRWDTVILAVVQKVFA